MDVSAGATKKEALIKGKVEKYDFCQDIDADVSRDIEAEYQSLGIGTFYAIDNIRQKGELRQEFFRKRNP